VVRTRIGLRVMNNPVAILSTFDANLRHKTELTLYGRSALALGFPETKPEYKITQDVDVIFPLQQLELLKDDESFWLAQELSNQQLQSQGLYLTHLFSEQDIIIQPDWLSRRVSITATFQKLSLFRPGTIDLILTKMMRDDRQDLDDIRFLLKQENLSPKQLTIAFERARVPQLPEFDQIFKGMQPKVLALATDVAVEKTS
jgi:hypothetical protein